MEDSRVSIRVDIVVTEGREGRERGGTRVSSSEEEGGDDEGDGEGRTSIADRRQGEIGEEQDDDQDSGQTLWQQSEKQRQGEKRTSELTAHPSTSR